MALTLSGAQGLSGSSCSVPRGVQIGSRAERMELRGADHVFLYSATRLEDVLQEIAGMQPRAVIIDSIQTLYLEGTTGSPGSVTQVRSPRSIVNVQFSQRRIAPKVLSNSEVPRQYRIIPGARALVAFEGGWYGGRSGSVRRGCCGWPRSTRCRSS